jgi:hypothetical protein
MLITEYVAGRSEALPLLARYIARAHEEGRSRLAKILGDPFDARRAAVHQRAFAFYPRHCDALTMQGFFGEIIAGLAAELYFPARTRWYVPAFAFYEHSLLFQELVRASKEEQAPQRAIGHFGDDCLAFALQRPSDEITRILICEAKCTLTHRSSLIRKAHEKLGDQPIDVTTVWLQTLIDSLDHRNDEHAAYWLPILESFKDSPRFDEQFRRNLVSYTHGKRPRAIGKTWIDPKTPRPEYRSSSFLEAVEIHFVGLKDLIDSAYEIAYP